MTEPGCGTNAGYSVHRKLDEDACLLCLAAHATYNRQSRYRLASHGTVDGLHRHALRGTPVCDLCLDVACRLEAERARRYYRDRLAAAA